MVFTRIRFVKLCTLMVSPECFSLVWIPTYLLTFETYDKMCCKVCFCELQKGIKLKELHKKRKGWKKESWPQSHDDVQLLLSLIDIKVISRVLRMMRISKEQLFWCEEKMKKLDFCDGKLQRDPSPILFPC